MNNNNYLYKVENLCFHYSLGKQQVPVLSELSLQIPQGTLTTISGPSGSGKSTLLNILGLIEPVPQGMVWLGDEDIGLLYEKRKNQLRKFQIGFIFQQFHLIPVLSAEENVKYFLARNRLPKPEIQERTDAALAAVGLWAQRHKKPGQLSGGQMQRVAIARALAKAPLVIIGDEPTASLDQKTGREIMELLSALVVKESCSVVLTTHDPMVQSFAACNFHIQDGKLYDPISCA
jgi:ABC-type lipoprotein export system ATPase subunit